MTSYSAPLGERRQFGRRLAHIHGRIKIAGRPPIPCLIQNLSVRGALLKIGVPTWLPYLFTLVLDETKCEFHCEIRHQRETSIGVNFAESPKSNQVRHTASYDHSDVTRWSGPTSSKQRFIAGAPALKHNPKLWGRHEHR